MIEVYHTRRMEDAVRALAERYPRVFVRNKNQLHQPIRLKRKLIADLNPYVVLSQPAWNSQRDAWNEKGGVLIYDRKYFKESEKIEGHHAQFISECPMSLQDLDDFTECTHEVAVIFKPFKWEPHVQWVDLTYPSAATCQPIYEAMMAGKEMPALTRLFEFRPGFHVRTDDDIAAECNVTRVHVKRIRRRLFRPWKAKNVAVVVPRARPSDGPLGKAYDLIMKCPEYSGTRLLLPSFMVRNSVGKWQMELRALARAGAVVRKPDLWAYWPEKLGPNWTKVQSWHEQYHARLVEMIEFLERTPEY